MGSGGGGSGGGELATDGVGAGSSSSVGSGGGGSGGGGSGGGGGSAGVRVFLPHNSAVVMWDDAQEGWSHSVPRCADSSIHRHPVAGLTRISLTFRMKRTDLPPLPNCRCGVPAALKARGCGAAAQYWLFCDPSRADAREHAGQAATPSVEAQGEDSMRDHERNHERAEASAPQRQCGFRQRCLWAEQEATRLRALLEAPRP